MLFVVCLYKTTAVSCLWDGDVLAKKSDITVKDLIINSKFLLWKSIGLECGNSKMLMSFFNPKRVLLCYFWQACRTNVM